MPTVALIEGRFALPIAGQYICQQKPDQYRVLAHCWASKHACNGPTVKLTITLLGQPCANRCGDRMRICAPNRGPIYLPTEGRPRWQPFTNGGTTNFCYLGSWQEQLRATFSHPTIPSVLVIGSTFGHVCWGLVPQQRVVSGETVPPVPETGQGPFMGRDPVIPGPKNLVFWRENNGLNSFRSLRSISRVSRDRSGFSW